MNRTWAEINLDALKYNFSGIKKCVKPETKVMSVVKADAYGHGYEKCCKTLLECGTDAFAVATLSEALQIRRLGYDTPILILGVCEEEQAEELVRFGIMPNVHSIDFAKKISEVAQKMQKTAKIHIKIDTGMSRLGYVAGDDNSEVLAEIIEISKLPNIKIEGIFSHFACADEKEPEYTKLQFSRFMNICDGLSKEGVDIPLRHIANSAAIIMYPEMQLDMVRAGIILYGCYPSDEVDKKILPLKPVMTVKSHISLIKEAKEGVGVSYGKTYITEGKTKIATVPIGYADGYLRCLAKKAKMEVGTSLCSVIGRICMDQCMIDVTNVNNICDEVTIFGDGQITADDIASWMGSINYEVLCLISARVPRVYKEKGREDEILDKLEKI